VYVLADTGLMKNDGEKLYTFIFDAADSAVYDNPEIDGLGTCNVGEGSLEEAIETKNQMEHVDYYNGEYGELYFAYSPIIDENGEIIAIIGTDVELAKMNEAIARSSSLFNTLFIAFFIVLALFIFIFFNRSIAKPLRSLTDMAYELAEGNIYMPAPESAMKQRSEIGILAHAINNMSLVYQDLIVKAGYLFTATNTGRLNVRSDASKFKGDIQGLVNQINETLDATTLYLNSIPEGLFIMNKDFEVYFRNEYFHRNFSHMHAMDLMFLMFPFEGELDEREKEEYLKARITAALEQNNSGEMVWINDSCFSVILREIVLSEIAKSSILVIIIDITDLMREKENAQAAAEAKSSFLSRMSHEMRTPMNAIIGMTKIAEGTDDVTKLKHCLAAIGTSSDHLLGIINDVLDMSKIDAGKLNLESAPMNLEQMLQKVCDIIADNMEKKHLKFYVTLDKNLDMNYVGDSLRLSQVITNLLSNAVKFTPENGTVTLAVEKVTQHDKLSTLRFSVTDTGIGMSKEQISRLFNAFEQADGSTSRKFGGTGLGLAISKNIVEKMGGRVWVESEPGVGSIFGFEISLERVSHQDIAVSAGISPSGVRLLIIESDDEVRGRFVNITENFGMAVDAASDAEEALRSIQVTQDENRAYDLVFIDFDLPEVKDVDFIKRLNNSIKGEAVVAITTFMEWHQLEKEAFSFNVERFITKPLFPSSILDVINETFGDTVKSDHVHTVLPESEICDLSGIHIVLAEDIEINREIFLSLLEQTGIAIDIAENGLVAVEKFRDDPDKYDLIVMDIQMPEMDGYQAARAIREMDIPRAKTIPIIAMTANAFKEDIDRCLESGMNDHLAKPIDEKSIISKILHYCQDRIDADT